MAIGESSFSTVKKATVSDQLRNQSFHMEYGFQECEA